MSLGRALPPLAALALLSACAAGPGGRTVVDTVRSADMQWAGGGPVPTEVRGTPPDGSSPEAVIAGLRIPTQGGALRAIPAPAPGTGQRLVVAFGATASAPPCTPLADGASGSGAAGGEFVALLAVCRGTRERGRARMRSTQTAGPADAGFTRAMSIGLSEMTRRQGDRGR